MARLIEQGRLFTSATGGVLPEQSDLSAINRILDIGCGPGEWVLDAAFSYPEKEVAGIDISQTMIRYAVARARSQGIANATFGIMDASQPLDFSDTTFDLVNVRSASSFLVPSTWPAFLHECKRILRPGGIIRLTEPEWDFCNSAAFERLCLLSNQAMKNAGRSFSPSGLHWGIFPQLAPLLREAGYHHIERRASILDYSAGEIQNNSFTKGFLVAYQMLKPFIVKWTSTTEEEFDALLQQAQIEVFLSSFAGVCLLMTVWGVKPE